ncbi:tripartite tricarboxylate transporter substrate binding protein [Candidimonas nitroreducens]|uniref:ABC transporter substrate-binding protein n=1 Tax=Candidimonas nitroreducens TaxID=683354 RepID=A0A225M869_9BURK|nr:tripartite tricarboxylate transporter substrate binding protein [Candidimonas nitroreducens]OWT57468.1 ABC transporter substrate-binding protein [Candidimonas nitroreducens]
MRRRTAMIGAAFIPIAISTSQLALSAPDKYPKYPIRLVTAYAPGGTTDILARLLAPKMTKELGVSVIVENRAGGNTIIGTAYVAHASPDGYTLLLASNSHVILPAMMRLPYDPLADFTPIATISSTEQVLVLNPAFPARNLSEFIAYAKAHPGELNYASSGTGNVTQLASEMFNLATGAHARQVNYKGTGPAIIDVIAGRVQMNFSPIIAVLPYIKQGQLRAIGVSGKKRFRELPNVPTFTESGYPSFDVRAWYGLLGPAGMPQPVVGKLAATINKILAQPDIRAKLAQQGSDPFISTRAGFSKQIATELALYKRVVKDAHIKTGG